MFSRWHHSKLYQLIKFLQKDENQKKDIIIAIPICNQTGQEGTEAYTKFCINFLKYLPAEKGDFIDIRICSYQYYECSHQLVGKWSSNQKETFERIASPNKFLNNISDM